MKLVLVLKNVPIEESHLEVNDVVQLDLCNMSAIDNDVSDSGWDFVSIVTKKDGQLKKQVIKLEDIMQFSIIKGE